MTRGAGRLRAARLLYRALLYLYPPSFRRRFAEQMTEDAGELVRAERARGSSTAALGVRIGADLVRSAPREWLGVVRRVGRSGDTGRALSGGSGALHEDLSTALRQLVRSPGFSLGVVLLLGAGIGAATTVASVASAYLLRPLPYPEADRLVMVRPTVPVLPSEAADLFEIPVTWDLDAFSLVGEEGPELVNGSWVAPGYFEAFGMRTALGRLFTPEETGPGGSSVAVISHGLWQRRWGGDPAVIGRTVRAYTSDRPDDAEVFTVVGVLAPGTWHYNRYTEIIAPLRAENPVYLARLRADLPPEEARRALEERGRARMASVPEGFRVGFVPLQAGYTEPLLPLIAVGAAAVAIALLVAWANVAVLLMLRAQKRGRELWVRRALGAGRARLAGQLGIEALLLSGAAALVGVLLAVSALDLLGEPLQAGLGREVPGGLGALRVDGRALLATAVATAITALVFGLVPWVGALGEGAAGGLAQGGRGHTGGPARARLRSALVTLEIALSLTLVVGGALAVRSARHLATLDLGFRPEGVYTANVLLRSGSYPDVEDRAEFFSGLSAALRDIPALETAALGVMAPFHWGYVPRPLEIERGGARPVGEAAEAIEVGVGPGWFETLGVPLVRGRPIEADDLPGGEPVAVVSAALAGRLWPGQDPLGRRLRFRSGGAAGHGPVEPEPWLTVVGTVPDVHGSLEGGAAPTVYLPMAQQGSTTVTILARVRPGAPHPLGALTHAVGALDPSLALYATGWLEEAVALAGRPTRFLAAFLAAFSCFALGLATLGLYAVLAFAAAQRRRDVAIRMALGARGGVVVRDFLREGMALAGAGVLLGTAGAVLLARRLSGLLHGVDPMAPGTYAVGAVGLMLVALVATWVPARRAARGDPATVLGLE